MKGRLLPAVLGVLLIAVAGFARAEVTVEGRGADGKPGGRVFLELIFDYGSGFELIAEELLIRFSDELKFVKDASTIDLFGQTRTLEQYKTILVGSFLENTQTANLYTYSFFPPPPQSQLRRGTVQLRAAFDIPMATTPGRYGVSVSGLLYDESECCDLPAALQNLSVNVLATAVPEPKIALLLLPALALIARVVRRRNAPAG